MAQGLDHVMRIWDDLLATGWWIIGAAALTASAFMAWFTLSALMGAWEVSDQLIMVR